ncbi:5-bromo-4-chloroindolyl phosphate hydrolysis family protein [Loigolactobacillus zhaoyuanensis]|uniref:5-bromo-4-chloroindolyl phosphate hydrolysis family protein n=1 Tax=Loigolactobacillus zhaoyuanensis TaxID=2486017 RepID=A0ABW8U8E8_9LACO|nr:5-bromo-4-chloroindolyl phosphate hydrolysis family protein [Loigolactobacillus zhaoyuanensis]
MQKRSLKRDSWLISVIIFIASFYGLRLIFNGCMNSSFSDLIVVISALLITGIVRWWQLRRPQATKKLQNVDRDMLDHYHAAGMSDDDIQFFRETMSTAKTQIDQLNQNMQRVPKLKAIELHTEPVKVSRAIFKTIVAEPQKLQAASDFLYRHLPLMVDFTEKYIAISKHEVKDKDAYTALDKSATKINDLAQQFRADYKALVADDLSDIDVDMALAKAALKQSQSVTKESDSDE